MKKWKFQILISGDIWTDTTQNAHIIAEAAVPTNLPVGIVFNRQVIDVHEPNMTELQEEPPAR